MGLREVRETPRFNEIQCRVGELMAELNSLLDEATELTGGDYSAVVNAVNGILFIPKDEE